MVAVVKGLYTLNRIAKCALDRAFNYFEDFSLEFLCLVRG